MTNTTSTITPGTYVLILERGAVIGGGELLAVDGKTVTIAQVVEHREGGCSERNIPGELVREDVCVDTHTLSRTVKMIAR